MTTVSYMRQNRILDPNVAAKMTVSIYGCGTVGSNVAVQLAKAGFGNFKLYDMDAVEAHNIPSQDFTIDDIGEPKVNAVKKRIHEVSSIANVSVSNVELQGGEPCTTEIAVLAVDSIELRKKLYELSIRINPMVKAFMDFRMGGHLLQAWFVQNNNAEEKANYEKTFFEASEAVDLGCGSRTFAPVGALSGAVATQLLTKYVNQPWEEEEDKPPFYTYLDMAAFELQVAG